MDVNWWENVQPANFKCRGMYPLFVDTPV